MSHRRAFGTPWDGWLLVTRLAASPVSWGIDFADHPDNVSWRVVLDEIAQSGLHDLELGPVDYIPTESVREELERRGLRALGTWLVLPLSAPRAEIDALGSVLPTLDLIAASRGTHVILIDRAGGERASTAGRPAAARRLTGPERARFAQNVLEIAGLARERGLDVTFHPHTATFVEFEDEIEWLLEATAAEGLRLCLDTAHMAWAGMDPALSLRRYGSALGHVHLKDLDRERVASAQARELGFWEAIAAGVFCPIGSGCVRFGAVAQALREIGYRGLATIEQDRAPRDAGPALAQLRTSLVHLEAAFDERFSCAAPPAPAL
jgi:inosose dehydratase